MMRAPESVLVKAEFDDNAKVWIATSDDVPGLVAEDADLMNLLDTVGELIPILLAENGMLPDDHDSLDVPLCLVANATAKRRVLIPA